jgi:hypothetical protein
MFVYGLGVTQDVFPCDHSILLASGEVNNYTLDSSMQGGLTVKYQQTQYEDEVLDRNLLVGLAILAKANGHSVTEELNTAVSSYVMEHLPQRLNEEDSNLYRR